MKHGMHDAKKSQDGEAHPARQPSAVDMLNQTTTDGPGDMAGDSNFNPGRTDKHAAPGSGPTFAATGKATDHDGMQKLG